MPEEEPENASRMVSPGFVDIHHVLDETESMTKALVGGQGEAAGGGPGHPGRGESKSDSRELEATNLDRGLDVDRVYLRAVRVAVVDEVNPETGLDLRIMIGTSLRLLQVG